MYPKMEILQNQNKQTMENTTLPEKWCIKRNEENYEVVNEYFNSKLQHDDPDFYSGDTEIFLHCEYVDGNRTYPHMLMAGTQHPDFTEIDFEIFLVCVYLLTM